MDGLAVAAALVGIRAGIEGGVIRSVYEPVRGTFVLHVFAGRNARILVDPRRASIHETALDLSNPPQPGPFVMLVRRHARGGRIAAVRQRELDRVVTIEIDRREGRATRRLRLVAELAGGRGNLFLLEEERVLGSARRDPKNRPGGAYVALPPQDRIDPRRVSVPELARLLADRPALDVLTRSLDGIGRQTAEDLLGSLDPGPGAAGAEALHAALRRVLDCVERPSPCVLLAEARATFYPMPAPAEPTETFAAALDRVAAALLEPTREDEATLRRALRRALDRRARTLEALSEWLDASGEADRLRSWADLLMIHHATIDPRSGRAELTDPRSGQRQEIRLIPSLTAIENAQRLYERAKRLRRGRPHVFSRIERLKREIELLEAAIDAHVDGRAVEEKALALLPKGVARPVPPKREARGIQVDGFTILIGRSAAENDRLLRDAAPDDLWLHVKRFAGSHVIVKRGGRGEIPESVVRHAAQLAVRHSKACSERRAEVVVTQVKHVRKRKGAPAGLANVSRGDTLTVEPCKEGQ